MSRQETVPVYTAKEALAHLEDWSLHAPKQNKYTHKKEAAILYKNELVCIQIGTPKQPIYCGTGPSRWSQKDNRFVTVTAEEGSQWAYQAQQESQFQRKVPGGKLQAQLTLHEYDTEGTQGFYAYMLIKGVIDRVIKGLAHGVPDYDQKDADGKPKIVQAVELPTSANTPEERERLFKYSLTTPLEEPSGTWAPKVKTKIRYSVKNDDVGLEMDVLNADAATSKPLPFGPDQLRLFKERTRGIFIMKFNPLQFKRNEINMTIDIITAMIKPSVSMFKGVGIRLDTGEDDDVEMTDDGAVVPAGTGAGNGASST